MKSTVLSKRNKTKEKIYGIFPTISHTEKKTDKQWGYSISQYQPLPKDLLNNEKKISI